MVRGVHGFVGHALNHVVVLKLVLEVATVNVEEKFVQAQVLSQDHVVAVQVTLCICNLTCMYVNMKVLWLESK